MNKRAGILHRIILALCTLLPVAYKVFLDATGLQPIISVLNWMMLLVFLGAGIAWSILILRCRVERKALKLLKVIPLVSAVVLSIGMIGAMALASMFHSTPIQRSTSPSGKNELVIMETNYMEAVYYARPVRYKWFFQDQGNGFVSSRDAWGSGEIEIEWVNENKAVIKVESGSGDAEHTIFVNFLQIGVYQQREA